MVICEYAHLLELTWVVWSLEGFFVFVFVLNTILVIVLSKKLVKGLMAYMTNDTHFVHRSV